MHFIACDYDGTIKKELQVSDNDVAAITSFKNNNNKFALCSGRPINSILNQLEQYQIPFDYVIGVNGAIAIDANHNLLYAHHFDNNAITTIFEVLNENNELSYAVSNGFDNCYVELGMKFERTEEFEFIRGFYINAQSEEAALKLGIKLNEKLAPYNITAYPNYHYVALGMNGIHKGYGVAKVCELINQTNNIHVIGDDYNDIPMLTRFNSFGIKSGVADAICYAKHQVESVLDAINQITK